MEQEEKSYPINAYLAIVIAIVIASVAAWYSIKGLMTLFSAAAFEIAVMGVVLEIGKLVTASWLYRNWHSKGALLKAYLSFALVILMLITSLGIFGFLSKAHLEQSIQSGGNNIIKVESLQRRIDNEQRAIRDAETVISQLDTVVETLLKYDRVRGEEGALAVRKSQTEERAELNSIINTSFLNIEELQIELLPLKKQQLELEVEVGPLMYVAELVYGKDAKENLGEAVRLVILLIVMVFDPLAVLLLIAGNIALDNHRRSIVDGKVSIDASSVAFMD